MLGLNVMLEAQEDMTYQDLLAVAQRAEGLGFEGVYRSDHYKSVAGRDERGSTDAWAALAGLARETERISLGTLVSPATFRMVGNLAKVVATVAEMAGTWEGASRIHLGMGAGWYPPEHTQHGFPFPPTGTRMRRLEEDLQVIRGFWDPARDEFSFDGEFVQVSDARFVPKPNPAPRLIVGGRGRVKTPRLAARYADELNGVFFSAEECSQMRAALDRACEAENREPADVTFSLMTGCLVGRTEQEFRERAARLQERSRTPGTLDEYLEQLSGAWVLGAPEQAAERLGRLAEAGVQRIMLQHQLFDDLEMLDVIQSEIAPRL